jgi:hypothetical protein
MLPNNGYQPLLDMLAEGHKAHEAGATVAALAMVYIGIDTLAWLSLPIGKNKQGRSDFYQWVDTYLKTDAAQPYQYVGKDVYAARCAVLHMFATLSDLHQENPPPKKFGYLDNGPHCTDGGDLVLISVAILLRDFSHGVRFTTAMQQDAELKARVDSRINELLNTTPIAP